MHAWIMPLRAGRKVVLGLAALLHLLSFIPATGQEKAGVDELINSLRSQDPTVRQRAVTSLAEQDKRAVPKLSAALSDTDPNVRRSAAYVLGEIRSDDKDAVEGLARLLQDNDRLIRIVAAQSLGQIGRGAGAAVPNLIELLKDNDPSVRKMAVQSLGEVRSNPREVIRELLARLRDPEHDVRGATVAAIAKFDPNDIKPFLFELIGLLRDPNPEVRAGAASIIGSVGLDGSVATADLIPLLKDPEFRVRLSSAQTLAEIGPRANTAVPALTEALTDRDHDIRAHAAKALGKVGAEAKVAIPKLTALLGDQDRDVRRFTADALSQIATALSQAEDVNSLEQLKEAEVALQRVENDPTVSARGTAVRQAINSLEAIRSKQTFWQRLGHFVRRHPYVSLLAGVYILLILFCVITFTFKPIWLIQLNEKLVTSADLTLSLWGGKFSLSWRHLFLIGFFHYRPRVLDAWVNRHINTARGSFETKTTVKDRRVYVSLPVSIDDKVVADFGAGHLRPIFSRNQTCVLILGEGGAGKTSLACLFGKWAMAKAPQDRLVERHYMLPVLIEEDFTNQGEDAEGQFITRVGNLVRVLTDERVALSAGLIKQLLQRRRLVVLIDGLSEMRDEPRKVIFAGINNIPVNASIITSRSPDLPTSLNKNIIKPLRLDKEQLLSIIVPYLQERGLGKSELFKDYNLEKIRRRLSDIIGGRELTTLLAKLYMELIIAEEGGLGDDLPRNIPDLMIEYVQTIYKQSGVSEYSFDVVLRSAQIMAWRCVKKSYRPVAVKRSDVQSFLGFGEKGLDLLKYLEGRLKLIQPSGVDQSRVRFSLDPLAEYLAGLHVINEFREDETKWQYFLNRAANQQGAPASIRDFLLAVRECCSARADEITVPSFVMDELDRLTAG
jgi:HEAT repeat protein